MAQTSTHLSKYAGLPDIDVNSPDVYETKGNELIQDAVDVNVDMSVRDEEVRSTQDIILDRLSMQLASTRFKDAVLDSATADFTDALAIRKRKMYKAYNKGRHPTDLPLTVLRSTNDKNGDEQDSTLKETPLEKLRRLIYEAGELEVELQQQLDENPTEEDVQQHGYMLKHVKELQEQLQLLESTTPQQGLPMVADEDLSVQQLMSQLQAFQAASLESSNTPSVSNEGEGVKYELFYTKDMVEHFSQSKAADLDRRIAQLEKVLGHSPASTDTTTIDIMSRVSEMQQQLSTLSDVNQLAQIIQLCKTAIREIEQLLSKKNTMEANLGSVPDEETVDELYNALKQAEEWSGVIPAIVDRLGALKKLHSEAAVFAETLTMCKSDQERLSESVKQVADVYKTVEQKVQQNQKTMASDMAFLEKLMRK